MLNTYKTNIKVKKERKGKCPCCKKETTWSKKYDFYCGCQGLGGNDDE